MNAARIHRLGPPEVVVIEEIARPIPQTGQVLVGVAASGVGPWDALICEGKSKVSPPPPLALGSDLSGAVLEVGAGVTRFKEAMRSMVLPTRSFMKQVRPNNRGCATSFCSLGLAASVSRTPAAIPISWAAGLTL